MRTVFTSVDVPKHPHIQLLLETKWGMIMVRTFRDLLEVQTYLLEKHNGKLPANEHIQHVQPVTDPFNEPEFDAPPRPQDVAATQE